MDDCVEVQLHVCKSINSKRHFNLFPTFLLFHSLPSYKYLTFAHRKNTCREERKHKQNGF